MLNILSYSHHFKCLLLVITQTIEVSADEDHWNLMFVDPCIIVQFIKKNPTRCNNVSKFYYSIFIWSSTCFERHTAHHQKPKTALAASGFSYVEGCWTFSWWTCQAPSRRVPGSIPGHCGFFSGASDSSMCPGVDSASKNEYQDIPGGKDGRYVRVTTLPPSCAECLEILEP
jgi:hypothetical protein